MWSSCFSIYNYIDGILVTDSKGYIEYFATYRPDVNKLKEKNILHKHITEVYPELTEETSSIMRVLRSGESISNEYQTLKPMTDRAFVRLTRRCRLRKTTES